MLLTEMDGLDERIIDELRHDGRQANTEIARRLGVSEATVRNRIQRLIGEGIIQIDARVNVSRLGYEVSTIIGVICDVACEAEIVRRLAAMDEIRYVSYVTGRYDLVLNAHFRSRQELFDFLGDRMASIEGIQRTETLHELEVAKRDYDFWELPIYE